MYICIQIFHLSKCYKDQTLQVSRSTVIMIPCAFLLRSIKTTDPEKLSEETFQEEEVEWGCVSESK